MSTELPIRVQKALNLKSDIGFDLILEDNDGLLIPVQCKYHSDPNRNVGWKEASTFVGLYNDKKICQEAFLCSNAFGVSKNFDSLQGKPINRILGSQWSNLDESFFSYISDRSSKKIDPYKPLKHQEKAIKDAKSYFLKQGNTKGKLIFPCGSGKSLTGFWFTQHLDAQTTLIAVPSLALIKQTLEVYFREISALNLVVKWLCVCSDSDIGSGVSEIKFSTSDIGIPSTTDSVKIKHWLERTQGNKRYVFTTYQSGQRLAEICKETGAQFDLGIFDEAHKTVGAKDKLFSHLLFHQNIKIDRRIFMTATERFYTGSKDDIASMDNEEIYGEVFSKMSFKDAIATKLLTDYKIITIDVAKEEIASFIRKNKLVELNPKYGKLAEARSLASMFALRKAMQKLPIKNAVSFHSSIDKARRAESIQALLSEEFGFEEIDTYTVNGKDSIGKREKIINEFASSDNALITNARCLTEGVDVPKIDCIVFSDPKRSKVDIVQALGRALRKKEGKEWGYVILPVVYDEKTHEIDNDSFKDILGIVRGLAANDERIIEYFKGQEDKENNQTFAGHNIFLNSNLSTGLSSQAISQLQVKIWKGLSRFEWINYEEAREIIRKYNFKSRREFIQAYELGEIQDDIPKAPNLTYLNTGWSTWSDFLGHDRIYKPTRIYASYEEAKKYAHKLNLSTSRDWIIKFREASFPLKYPKRPEVIYKKEWEGWQIFLNSDEARPNEILKHSEAKKYVRDNKINNLKEYHDFYRRDGKKLGFPFSPKDTYMTKGTWKGYEDFFGVQILSFREMKFLSFQQAKEIAISNKIKNRRSWHEFVRNFNATLKPRAHPQKYNEWISWEDFLGTGYLSYEQAKQKLKDYTFSNISNYKRKAKKIDLPYNADSYYSDSGWISWSDYLNITITNRGKNFLPFNDAKRLVHGYKFKNYEEFSDARKSNRIPTSIPGNPQRFYKEFTNIYDWIGPSYLKREFLNFHDAREYVHRLNIAGPNAFKSWITAYKENKIPKNIPKAPENKYKDEGWNGWRDWVGEYLPEINNDLMKSTFEEMRKKAHQLNFRSKEDYRENYKQHEGLFSNPNTKFKDHWKGWPDFLGYAGKHPNRRRKSNYLTFEELRSKVSQLQFQSNTAYKDYVRSNSLSENWPLKPERAYATEWRGWSYFLGK
ncbi:DEAD/DEAH box helicase family protein [Schleiferiaceae bacterium]|nr:DEAD/DEAH box helicase family protein [Schleiferiaceae bacterium]